MSAPFTPSFSVFSGGLPRLDFQPWRLSGVVVGAAINDPQVLLALGAAVHAAPYKAPPRGPVLYVKPRNTLREGGPDACVPGDADGFEVGATLGLVIGRETCRVPAPQALGRVAGWVPVADLSVAHTSYYRPGARFKARDASCLLGAPVAVAQGSDPGDVLLDVEIDGVVLHRVAMAGLLRPAAQLIADVSEFMTLHPGDLLLLGVHHGAPRVRVGQRFSVDARGVGRVAGRVVAAPGVDA